MTIGGDEMATTASFGEYLDEQQRAVEREERRLVSTIVGTATRKENDARDAQKRAGNAPQTSRARRATQTINRRCDFLVFDKGDGKARRCKRRGAVRYRGFAYCAEHDWRQRLIDERAR